MLSDTPPAYSQLPKYQQASSQTRQQLSSLLSAVQTSLAELKVEVASARKLSHESTASSLDASRYRSTTSRPSSPYRYTSPSRTAYTPAQRSGSPTPGSYYPGYFSGSRPQSPSMTHTVQAAFRDTSSTAPVFAVTTSVPSPDLVSHVPASAGLGLVDDAKDPWKSTVDSKLDNISSKLDTLGNTANLTTQTLAKPQQHSPSTIKAYSHGDSHKVQMLCDSLRSLVSIVKEQQQTQSDSDTRLRREISDLSRTVEASLSGQPAALDASESNDGQQKSRDVFAAQQQADRQLLLALTSRIEHLEAQQGSGGGHTGADFAALAQKLTAVEEKVEAQVDTLAAIQVVQSDLRSSVDVLTTRVEFAEQATHASTAPVSREPASLQGGHEEVQEDLAVLKRRLGALEMELVKMAGALAGASAAGGGAGGLSRREFELLKQEVASVQYMLTETQAPQTTSGSTADVIDLLERMNSLVDEVDALKAGAGAPRAVASDRDRDFADSDSEQQENLLRDVASLSRKVDTLISDVAELRDAKDRVIEDAAASGDDEDDASTLALDVAKLSRKVDGLIGDVAALKDAAERGLSEEEDAEASPMQSVTLAQENLEMELDKVRRKVDALIGDVSDLRESAAPDAGSAAESGDAGEAAEVQEQMAMDVESLRRKVNSLINDVAELREATENASGSVTAGANDDGDGLQAVQEQMAMDMESMRRKVDTLIGDVAQLQSASKREGDDVAEGEPGHRAEEMEAVAGKVDALAAELGNVWEAVRRHEDAAHDGVAHDEAHEQLSMEVSSLRRKVDALIQDVSTLQEGRHAGSAGGADDEDEDRESAGDAPEQLALEVASLGKKVNGLIDDVAQLRDQIDGLQGSGAEDAPVSDEIAATVAELREAQEQAVFESASVAKKVNALIADVAELSGRLEAKDGSDSEVAGAGKVGASEGGTDSVADLRAAQKQLASELASVGKKVSTLIDDVAAMHGALEGVKGNAEKTSEARAAQEQLSLELASLGRKVNGLVEDVSSLQDTAKGPDADADDDRIAELCQAHEALALDVASVSRKVDVLVTDAAATADTITAMHEAGSLAEVQEAQAQFALDSESVRRKVDGLIVEVAETREKVEALGTAADGSRGVDDESFASLAIQVSDALRRLEALAEQVGHDDEEAARRSGSASLNERLAALTDAMLEVQDELTRLKAGAGEGDSAGSAAAAQIAALAEDLAQVDQQVASLKGSVEALKAAQAQAAAATATQASAPRTQYPATMRAAPQDPYAAARAAALEPGAEPLVMLQYTRPGAQFVTTIEELPLDAGAESEQASASRGPEAERTPSPALQKAAGSSVPNSPSAMGVEASLDTFSDLSSIGGDLRIGQPDATNATGSPSWLGNPEFFGGQSNNTQPYSTEISLDESAELPDMASLGSEAQQLAQRFAPSNENQESPEAVPGSNGKTYGNATFVSRGAVPDDASAPAWNVPTGMQHSPDAQESVASHAGDVGGARSDIEVDELLDSLSDTNNSADQNLLGAESDEERSARPAPVTAPAPVASAYDEEFDLDSDFDLE